MPVQRPADRIAEVIGTFYRVCEMYHMFLQPVCARTHVHAVMYSLPYSMYVSFSPLPSAEQTNITFRSNSLQGTGSGFFLVAFQSELVCSTCRTLNGQLPTRSRVSMPRVPGCSTKLVQLGGLKLPRKNNCVSCLSIQAGTAYCATQCIVGLLEMRWSPTPTHTQYWQS